MLFVHVVELYLHDAPDHMPVRILVTLLITASQPQSLLCQPLKRSVAVHRLLSKRILAHTWKGMNGKARSQQEKQSGGAHVGTGFLTLCAFTIIRSKWS